MGNLPKKFQKRVEDFICEKCAYQVKGTGYTNHCPNCLWGKHVDINPGDRVSNCGGSMEPFAVALKESTYIIFHQCVQCNLQKKNKSAPDDNFEVILKLIQKPT